MNDPRIGYSAALLLKGFLTREDHERRFADLLAVREGVQHYVATLGLQVVIDDEEGYAYLTYPENPEDEDLPPRLTSKRPLGYITSLLLVLLRKRLGEHDATTGDSRLILSRQQIIDLVREALPTTGDEAKLITRISSSLEQAIGFGFLRPVTGSEDVEVRRILIAFVNGPWIANLSQVLEAYRLRISKGTA